MLLYLACKTRPDISHAVQQVSQFNSIPGHNHWIAVKHILRYLQATQSHGLLFDGNAQVLHAYFGQVPTDIPPGAWFSDSDWANDLDKRKSVGGYVSLCCMEVPSTGRVPNFATPLSLRLR
jgi:hypothetical protein